MRPPIAVPFAAGLALLGMTDHVQTASAPVANILRQLVVGTEPGRVVIRLLATHELAGALEAVDAPSRVFVDLKGVRPQVARSTAVGVGSVRRVRVGLNQARPAVTRVVVDLSAAAQYTLEHGDSQRELRLVIWSTSGGVSEGSGYAAWLRPTLDIVAGLLDQTSRLTLDSPAGQADSVRREWERTLQSIQSQAPPADRQTDHALLLEAARLGRIAAHNRSDATRLLADAMAGEAGARLLVSQARAALESVPVRKDPD